MIPGPIGSAGNDIVYRRRISNDQRDNGRDEGPFQEIRVPGQSFQRLQYVGSPRINPQRPDDPGGSSDQPAITGDGSHSRNPQYTRYQ
jgi:hypothetical protein